MTQTFKHTGEPFSGYEAATEWLKDNGYSVGAMQKGAPTGVVKGEDHYISKWRNLRDADKAGLDGKIEGDFRDGDVVLTLKDSVVTT